MKCRPPSVPYRDLAANPPMNCYSNAPTRIKQQIKALHCIVLQRHLPLRLNENRPWLDACLRNSNRDMLVTQRRTIIVPLLPICAAAVASRRNQTLPLVKQLEGRKIFHCLLLLDVVICNSDMRSKINLITRCVVSVAYVPLKLMR